MIKIILLVLAVCADCFAASICLGSTGVRISRLSAAVISLICTAVLTASVMTADLLGNYIEESICRTISSALLIVLGLFSMFQEPIKKLFGQIRSPKSTAAKVFLNAADADSDGSMTISVKEAIILAAALSADSVVTGISAGLGGTRVIPMTLLSLAAGYFIVLAGGKLGKRIVSTKKIDTGRLCGTLLIILAFLK